MNFTLAILIVWMSAASGLFAQQNFFTKYQATSTTWIAANTASSLQFPGPGESYDAIPDVSSRKKLNAILLSAVGVTTLSMAIPYLSFFVPPTTGNGANGVIAKDAIGNDVTVASWKESHFPGARDLVQGLKGDAAYLILDENKELAKFGLNAVCTHLGCVVPWVKAENKFICTCHGSQYDRNGKVVRGPAPLPLALEHVEESSDGKVVLRPWTEIDFRTGSKPWWK